MLNYLWVKKDFSDDSQMDQQKCIFMDTHIYTKGREGDGKILRIVSLNLESVGGYYVSVIFFS